jgi:hypothetical protein
VHRGDPDLTKPQHEPLRRYLEREAERIEAYAEDGG